MRRFYDTVRRVKDKDSAYMQRIIRATLMLLHCESLATESLAIVAYTGLSRR